MREALVQLKHPIRTTLTARGKHQAEKLGLNVYMHEKQRDVVTKKNEKGL